MKTTMNNMGFVLALMLITNLSFAQVKSDYDKEVDFTQYKSYTFAGWQDDSDKILNDFDKKRILDALKSEFSNRGMELVKADGDADAVITLFIVVNQKTSTTAYTDFNGGMGYRGRWGWGMGAGMASATTTYSENDYTEGTLVIDMYDTDGKHLLWQGVITSTVQEKPEKREKTIPKKMAKLMKSYPVKKKK